MSVGQLFYGTEAWQRGQDNFSRASYPVLGACHACEADECIDMDAMVTHGAYGPRLHVPTILIHGNVLSSAGFIMWGSEQLSL